MMTDDQTIYDGLVTRQGLTPAELQAIEQLVLLCKERDGIEVKLNWDALRRRSTEETNDFFYYQKGELVGYLALFPFNKIDAKISAIVHPAYRREGIFRVLLTAGTAEVEKREIANTMLIVPTNSTSGQSMANMFQTRLAFSEYEMELGERKIPPNRQPNLSLQRAAEADVPFFKRCISSSFDVPEPDVTLRLNDPKRHYYLIWLEGEPIGTMAARTDETGLAMIYGFAVLPEYQGRGYGRQILSDTIQDLLTAGCTRIRLEVNCDNAGALGLYQSCGFEVTTGYDYYLL